MAAMIYNRVNARRSTQQLWNKIDTLFTKKEEDIMNLFFGPTMYKPCGHVDLLKYEENSVVPISTTHEMLEMGHKGEGHFKRYVGKKQINFISYIINENPLITYQTFPIITSYNRDYTAPYSLICPPTKAPDRTVDPLFNRRPVDLFDTGQVGSNKFTDDYLVFKSENRQKIDFMRQIRNAHRKLV